MSGAASRRRGHNAERAVAKWLRGHGFPDAQTTRAKLGHDGATAPGDIDFTPGVALEVKDVKASAWPSWRAQALAEAQGRIPVVVRRERGIPDVGLWHTQITAQGWQQIGGPVLHESFTCRRTEQAWVLTTFAYVIDLLRDDLPANQVAALDKVDWPEVTA